MSETSYRLYVLSDFVYVRQSSDNNRREQVESSCCVKQSDSPSMLGTYQEEPDQTNTDNSTNYYDTPKYVVDVFVGAVSKTYRRLPERRNHRHGWEAK